MDFIPTATSTRPFSRTIQTSETPADFQSSYERDFSNGDRLFLTFAQHAVRYEVPNELVQQEAGQRQDSEQKETSGQVHYTHAFSANILLSVAGSVRDAYALLNSNAQSTPVIVFQDRGYREGYVRADLAGHHGRHEWKFGVDGIFSPVNENLQYQITDPSQFDPGTCARTFNFPTGAGTLSRRHMCRTRFASANGT